MKAHSTKKPPLPEMRDGAFILEGKPTFLYSGELHYFRVEPQQWAQRLAQARQAGLNTVATYIPWRWHEPQEGRFDFEGRTHPRRNLREFVRLVREAGLYFIPRVGPVSNGEMMDEGLPGWLTKDYPAAFLSGKEGATIHHQSPPAYNSPLFLGKVRAWYAKVLPELTAHQTPDGPIVLFQLCNEIGMINWLGKIGDYADYSEQMYREFLTRRYKTIAKLNAVYGSSLKSFKDARQPSNQLDEKSLPILLDWADFYKEYYAAYFEKLWKIAEAHGVRTPVLANIPQFYDYDLRGRGIYSPATTSMFSRFAARVPRAVFGGAYQMRRLDYENFHDVTLTSAVVRTITPKGSPVVCAELQTGVLSDRPRLYPADVELNLKTSLMSGLDAVNCYMFSGGTNEPDMGQFGRYHEWQAPVASDGTLRPHYESLRRFGGLINGFSKEIAGLPPAVDLQLGHYSPYFDTLYLEGALAEKMFAHRNEYYFDGLARLAWLSGHQTSAVDLKRDSLSGVPALAVYSHRFMDEATQNKLIDYVVKGGRLLFCGDVLLNDERSRPCSALLKRLKLAAKISPHVRTLELFGQEVFVQKQDVSVFSGLTKSDEVIARLDGKPCGLVRSVGKGKIALLGFPLNDKFDYFKTAMSRLLGTIGVSKTVDCGTPDVVALLRAGAEGGFLMLGNFHDHESAAHVRVEWRDERVDFPLELERRTAVVVPLSRPLPGGGRIRFASCEVHSAARVEGGMELSVLSGTRRHDVIAFDELNAFDVRADRGTAVLRREGRRTFVDIEHPRGEFANRLLIHL